MIEAKLQFKYKIYESTIMGMFDTQEGFNHFKLANGASTYCRASWPGLEYLPCVPLAGRDSSMTRKS